MSDLQPMLLKIGFISLGCPKNQLDCELMLARAEDAGCQISPRIAEADVIVVNTCSFIQPAIDEARAGIREALRYKAHGRCRIVVVAGCLSQYWGPRAAEEYPLVDLWLTPDNPVALVDALAGLLDPGPDAAPRLEQAPPRPEFLATFQDRRVVSTPPSLAYLKIAEGCDHRCRFCLIPQLRGKYRSRQPEDIVAEFHWLLERGTPEIVLVSQDSTRYGADLASTEATLAGLLARLAPAAGEAWLRVMYLHPDGINSELLRTWRELGPGLLPYFDLPLQHVNAELLRRMGRRGGPAEYLELLKMIRAELPQAVIRTSLIVGYPGETEAQFEQLRAFVAAGPFDRVGVFCYSELPEMRSAKLTGRVPEPVKEQRRLALLATQEQIAHARGCALIGSRQVVVLEGMKRSPAGGGWEAWGRTWRDAYSIDGLVHVNCLSRPKLYQRLPAIVTDAAGWDLTAKLALDC